MAEQAPHTPADPAHDVPYGFYILIWLTLLVLTQFTVTAGQMELGTLGMIIAGIVTPAKALLVLFYFMHLRYEGLVVKGMFAFAIVMLVATIAGSFIDYSFR